MNEDAQKEIDRLLGNLWSDIPSDREVLAEKIQTAMRWAYADAISVCDQYPKELDQYTVAELIKERMK